MTHPTAHTDRLRRLRWRGVGLPTLYEIESLSFGLDAVPAEFSALYAIEARNGRRMRLARDSMRHKQRRGNVHA